MSVMADFSEEERELLYELTSIGASHASMAFTLLLHRAIAPSAPQFRVVEEYGTDETDETWQTGVIFQADGELTGLVLILLPATSCQIVAQRLIHEECTDDPAEAVESALRELGNIVASHTMSAMADRLGGRILLSVPLLVMEDADLAFAALLHERGSDHYVECELTDSARAIRARLIFVPESKA